MLLLLLQIICPFLTFSKISLKVKQQINFISYWIILIYLNAIIKITIPRLITVTANANTKHFILY